MNRPWSISKKARWALVVIGLLAMELLLAMDPQDAVGALTPEGALWLVMAVFANSAIAIGMFSRGGGRNGPLIVGTVGVGVILLNYLL